MSLTDLIRRPNYDRQQHQQQQQQHHQQQQEPDDNESQLFEFDADDPDFDSQSAAVVVANERHANVANFNLNTSALRKVQTSPMSLSGLQNRNRNSIVDNSFSRTSRMRSSNNSLAGSDSSLCSINSGANDNSMLTIESLHLQLNCCHSCGVSWQHDHVSLDCSECGGYSLSRPCPVCEGKCGLRWKRDLAASHSLAKANWNGVCGSTKATSCETDLICRLNRMATC